MIIHGDPELTAIVARLEAVLAHPRAQATAHRPYIERYLYVAGPTVTLRSAVLRRLERAAFYLASDVADVPGGPTLWGTKTPAAEAMWRYALQGLDHVDLCMNGLTEFSMHLQSQEVA